MKSLRLIFPIVLACIAGAGQAGAQSAPGSAGQYAPSGPTEPPPAASPAYTTPKMAAPPAPSTPKERSAAARPTSSGSAPATLTGTNIFVVTTTADTGCSDNGPISLRCAILLAEISPANVAKVIDFNIPVNTDPGCVGTVVVCTISLGSDLPDLTAANTTIDGYSQPGASKNTVAVGDNARIVIQVDGKQVKSPFEEFLIQASHDTIDGLSLTNYGGNGAINSQGVGNRFTGNFIGLTPGGAPAGSSIGIGLWNVGDQVIGGTSPGDRNIISGNGFAVWLPTSGNTVQGNYIGTDVMGQKAVPNGAEGIGVVANRNTIGGTVPGAGNLISGNAWDGIDLGSDENTVAGNLIGTNAAGTAAIPNSGGSGISVNGSSHNTIGGTVPAARNVISGNPTFGIVVWTSGNTPSNDNTIEGNYIGTNEAGTAALPNGAVGLIIQSGTNNLIGGTASGARNVISGNGPTGEKRAGIYIESNGNTIQGNYVGTNAAGTAALGNGAACSLSGCGGIFVDRASNNTIGGGAPGAGNLVSGNHDGVTISTGGSNTVQGNSIGTNAAGTARLGNQYSGVVVYASANNLIGGSAAGSGNLVSGNGSNGVVLWSTSGSNTVAGNLIGTDRSGAASLGNGADGIAIWGGQGNVLGGALPGARNVISGNKNYGVDIEAAGSQVSTNNLVFNNFIGTNAAGTAALGNAWDGVVLFSTNNQNQIGASTPGEGNLISGNGGNGVAVLASGNALRGNRIGTNAAGIAGLKNGQNGVLLLNGASNNIIGGSTKVSNLIADNAGAGVLGSGDPTTTVGNQIRQNSIFGNGNFGINLGRAPTACATATPGAGPGTADNDNIPCPVITRASRYVIRGTGLKGGTVDAYLARAVASDKGHGEGMTYLGTGTVGNDGTWQITTRVGVSPNQQVTATQTAKIGQNTDTSEFSANVSVH